MAVAEGVFAWPLVAPTITCFDDCTGIGAQLLYDDLVLGAMVLVPAAIPPWILALAMSAAWVRVRRRRGSHIVEPSPHSSDSMPPGGGGGGADLDQTIG